MMSTRVENQEQSISTCNAEVNAGQRFTFGANWTRFLSTLDDIRIEAAVESLRNMLGIENLTGLRFLDVGSGSGLFSLAARRLAATVHSFDFDPQSVACTAELRRRYFDLDPQWQVEQGSVLDKSFLSGLGQFDVVYSWGVLHHTGNMWQALADVIFLVKPGGMLFIAIYNDQGWKSTYWHAVKRLFNRGRVLKAIMILVHLPLFIGRFIIRALTGRLREARGMSLWYDYIDWLGGYPFEVATPQQIVTFYRQRDFHALKVISVGGRMGCNEYVLRHGVGGR